MKKKVYKIKGQVWLWGYSEEAPWHFVSVPKKETAQIKKDFGKLSKGWRSLPIMAKVGEIEWKTSIFLDSRTDTYLLPLKAQVRRKEAIFQGEYINFSFKILVG